MAFLFINFPFYGGIGKRSSAGYDMKVLEYMEFLRKIQPRKAMTNDTSLKSSIAPQSCKVASTHANEISGWKILSRILHSRAPHISGMNGGVKSDLAILAFKNGEQLKDFHSIIIILKQ